MLLVETHMYVVRQPSVLEHPGTLSLDRLVSFLRIYCNHILEYTDTLSYDILSGTISLDISYYIL